MWSPCAATPQSSRPAYRAEQIVRSNDAVSVFGLKLRQERFAATDLDVAALNEPEAVTGYQTALEVRQPIFNGGQAFAGRAQATAGERGAESRLVRAEQEVRLHTAEAYWGLVLAGEALKAVQQGLQTVRAHATAARASHRESRFIATHYRTELAEPRLEPTTHLPTKTYSRKYVFPDPPAGDTT